MPWGFAAAALSIAGTVMQASAQSQAADAARAQGQANQQAANFQAQSMEIKAGQERAAAQRQAINQRRQESLVLSRSQAMAAASGGGASDPSIITNDSNITREGELGALTSLYQGEQSGQNFEENAKLTRYQGAAGAAGANAQASAMDTAAMGTVFSGIGRTASLYEKYGNGDTSSLVGYKGGYTSQADSPGAITWGGPSVYDSNYGMN